MLHGKHPFPQLDRRVTTTLGLPDELAEELHAKGDVTRFVARHVVHALEEAGQDLTLAQVPLDEVLAGDGKHSLNHDVVQRHALGEQLSVLGSSAESVRHAVQLVEHLSEAPR